MFEFLKGNPFALHISDSSVKVLKIEGSLEKPEVKSLGEKSIPQGAILNGDIVDQKMLASIIKDLLTQAKPNKITQKNCLVTIPESQVFGDLFFLPKDLSGSGLEKVIQEKSEQTLPFPSYMLKCDYVSFPTGESQAIFLASTKKLIIAQYYETIKQFCGLTPIIFEPEFISLIRNFNLPFNQKEGLVFIYQKEKSITWYSFWGGLIFDSNTLLESESEDILKDLKSDLQKSIKNFQNQNKQTISKILIAGVKSKAITLKDSLKNIIPSDPILVNQKTLDLTSFNLSNLDNWDVIGGLALNTVGGKTITPINFLKR